MDFIEGLHTSNGYSVVIVVVYKLSKYANFIPMKHPFTAIIVAKLFVSNIVKLRGMPTSIMSEKDKVFINSFWCDLF